MSFMRSALSLLGAALGVALIGMTLSQGDLIGIFLNEHGILMVFGGTIAATMISTPADALVVALRELRYVFFPPSFVETKRLSEELVALSAAARRDGLMALQKHGENLKAEGDGFLAFALEVALENGDQARLRKVLEDGIRQREGTMNRAAGVFQTMAFLGPMFGLLGTVMGIVGVLKQLSNPQSIGPAMAIALTTAFYGILTAALICNPIALRIRARGQDQRRMHDLIKEALLNIVAGAVPLQVERHLKAFAGEV
jgi:chemotaxis protein MotA